MSAKSIIGGALTLVGVALTMTGIGAPLGMAISSIGLSWATVIGVGLMVAGSVLMGPAVPKMPGSLQGGGTQRLHASLDPGTPRKILLGKTAGETDVRYQTFTGANQSYLEQIICVASHKVNSIYELWLDNELAWSSAGGVVAKFAPFLTITTRAEGTSANGIAIDTVWTATATLTGCAYFHAKFLLIRDDGNGGNDSPFATGVTSRMTVRCEGALVYDPRLDSTVTGGAGTHRADNQATWAWDANASRNPALQLLWYLLGWEINTKLAVGMGLPAARIDLPSFITAANACDESVTKADLTTEPRYRTDGVLSESDDRTAVVDTLCASMNAILRDSGGKLSLDVLYNDLAAPIGSFDENDVIGALTWNQTPDLSATFNITRGKRIDPADNALYQPVDYPEVKLTSPDGIDRIDTADYPLVESNGQAQRLAKQRLQRGQYQGRLSFVGKPSWWQTSVGDVVQFSAQTYGWTNKLFRVAGQRISRGGETEMLLVEEHADIYQWDNNEAPAVLPGAPTIYDTMNHPLLSTINAAMQNIDNISNDGILDRSEKQELVVEVNSIIDEKAGIEAEADRYGITTEKTNYTNAYTTLINYLNGLSPAYDDTSQDTVIVRATFNANFEDYYYDRQVLLNKIFNVAGSTSVVLDPISTVYVAADSNGVVKTGELPKDVGLTASIGTANITTLGTWSRTATTGVTCTIGAATGILNITALSASQVSVPVSFVYNGVTRPGTQPIVRQDDPPTNDGGGSSSGGTIANTTTLANATSTSYGTAESAVMTVTAGSAGKIKCYAPVEFKRTPGTALGTTGAFGKWQWRVPAGTWADIATEVADSGDASTDYNPPDPTVNWAGYLTVDQTKTGLTAGSDYEIKFLWRKVDVSGDVDDIYKSNTTAISADGRVS